MAPPHAIPVSWRREDEEPSFIQRNRSLINWIVYAVIVIGIASFLGYLAWTTREAEAWTQEETPEMTERKLKHHIYLFLNCGLASFVGSNLLCTVFPYIFRAIAPLVNPGHRKYWKIFFFMRAGVTCLAGAIGTYVPYTVVSGERSGNMSLADTS